MSYQEIYTPEEPDPLPQQHLSIVRSYDNDGRKDIYKNPSRIAAVFNALWAVYYPEHDEASNVYRRTHSPDEDVIG